MDSLGLAAMADHDWRRLPDHTPHELWVCILMILSVIDYLATNHREGWRPPMRGVCATIRARINGRAMPGAIPVFMVSHARRYERHYRSRLTPGDLERIAEIRASFLPRRTGKPLAEVGLDDFQVTTPQGRYWITNTMDECTRAVPAIGISSRKPTAAWTAQVVRCLPEGIGALRYDTEPIHGPRFELALYRHAITPLPTEFGCRDNHMVERAHRTLRPLIVAEAHKDPDAGIEAHVRRALRAYHRRFHRGLGDVPAKYAPDLCRNPKIICRI